MDQVLQSSELLTLILDMIHQNDEKLRARHKSSLAPLARVSSLWRDVAHPILWAAPDVEALAKIKSERRQQYANHIRRLDFSTLKARTDPSLHILFANLQFPKIKLLVLGHYGPMSGVLDPEIFRPLPIHKDWSISTSQYFHETLEDLSLLSWDSICTKSFFVHLAERCPRLKSVEFSAIGTQLEPDDLLDYFRASSHLENIQLRLGPEPNSALITGDLLLHFSGLTKLKYLLIDNELSQPEFFWAIKKQNVNPFQSLKRVDLKATSTVMSAAAHVLPNVEYLDLGLLNDHGSGLQSLSAMKSLRRLFIRVTRSTTLTPDVLLALQALHRLEVLCVERWVCETSIEAPNFTDSDFDRMLSGMPELREIVFEVDWQPQSFSVLSSLSKHCPDLEDLQLYGTFDLQALGDIPTVMFPRLRNLDLMQREIDKVPVRLTPMQVARLIDYHAPMLEDLYLSDESDERSISAAWSEFRA